MSQSSTTLPVVAVESAPPREESAVPERFRGSSSPVLGQSLVPRDFNSVTSPALTAKAGATMVSIRPTPR